MPKESKNIQAESFQSQSIYYSDPDCIFIASKDRITDFFPGCKMIKTNDGETEYSRDFCEKEKFSTYYYKDNKCQNIKMINIGYNLCKNINYRSIFQY